MSALHSARLVFAAFVYGTAMILGAGILVVNPVRTLLVVPVLTGVALLGHALRTSNLDQLGYATSWLWAAVLALSVIGGVAVEFVLRGVGSTLVELPAVRRLGTLCLVLVLVTVYIRGVRRAKQGAHRRSGAG